MVDDIIFVNINYVDSLPCFFSGVVVSVEWTLWDADVEHLYHYITESTSGSVLRGAQAHYAAEQVQAYDKSANGLGDLLEQHFGTRKFDLMDTDDLDEYIEDLIEDGTVKIEPEFFEGDEEKKYRIFIKRQRQYTEYALYPQ